MSLRRYCGVHCGPFGGCGFRRARQGSMRSGIGSSGRFGCAGGIGPACQDPAGAVWVSGALSCLHPISNVLKQLPNFQRLCDRLHINALNPGLLERKRRLEPTHFCHSELVRRFPKMPLITTERCQLCATGALLGPTAPAARQVFHLWGLCRTWPWQLAPRVGRNGFLWRCFRGTDRFG
ncbi:hypothetical protein ACVIRM_005156 [Rhizobium laguerreae]